MSNIDPSTPRRSSTNAPVPKVAAAGLGGAVTFLVVIIAKQVGADWINEEVAAAAVAVVAFLAGYFKRP
jgi:hypothetical protein